MTYNMRFLLIFGSFLYVAQCLPNQHIEMSKELSKDNFENVMYDLPQELVEKIHQELGNSKDEKIIADISKWAEQIINNIDTMMVQRKLDPAKLPNANLKLPVGGHINLTDGWLSHISTMARNGEVFVSYSSLTKTLEINLPIQFKELKFSYDYVAYVTLLNIRGEINGTVNHVKAHVVLSFDFHAVKAYLTSINIKDTGSIHIHFSGQGLLDWIVNLLSEVVSLFLHPVIIQIVQDIVKGIGKSIVDSINKILDEILHRNTF